MKKKISIVLPVYNAEKTIDRCIYSIISQSYKQFELIIINDASDDNSLEIINKYLNKDNRIVLINNNKNYGVSKSRNLGIKEATGEFITFIDSDDYYESNAIEKMYKLMVENDVDAVRFSFNILKEDKKIEKKYNKKYDGNILKDDKIKIFELDLINNRLQAYLWLLITKTNIVKKIKFDENIGMMEDTLWYLNFIKKIKNIYFSNEILYNYFVNVDSISNSERNTIKRIEDVLYLQDKYKEIFCNEQEFIQATTGLLSVIIENILRLENSNIQRNLKKDFYNKMKQNSAYKMMISKSNYKLIRLDRKIMIKLFNKNNYTWLEYYCKCKILAKDFIQVLKIFMTKVKQRIKLYKNKIASELLYEKYKKMFAHYKILDDKIIIEKIIRDNCSLARFGDGEFKWILGIKQKSFQNNNVELSQKLSEILNNNLDNLIIGIPKPLKDLKEYNRFAKKTWKLYIYMFGPMIKKLVLKDREYADTNITRFYMDYKRKDKCKEKIENIKKIWNNKDIIIIEGEKTRLGVGNDLFNNTKTINRILAPSVNAFDKFEEILNIAKEQKKKSIFLISLGPTATVLAYELAKIGYQAIDIGHIDVEYEWYLQKAKSKVPIKGKYVNEARDKGDLSELDINDEEYKKSILKIIK